MADGNTANNVRARIEANARAREILRGRIGAIVERNENAPKAPTQTVVMPDDKDAPKMPGRRKKGLLIGLMIAATIAIVGVIVGLIVVNIVNGNDSVESSEQSEESGDEGEGGCGNGESEDESVYSDEELAEITSDIMSGMSNMTSGEAVEYLSGKIEEYAGTEAEFNARAVLVYQLLNMGDENAALEVAEGVNVDLLVGQQILDYYNMMSKIYNSLGYTELSENYQMQYAAIYSAMYGDGVDSSAGEANPSDEPGEQPGPDEWIEGEVTIIEGGASE